MAKLRITPRVQVRVYPRHSVTGLICGRFAQRTHMNTGRYGGAKRPHIASLTGAKSGANIVVEWSAAEPQYWRSFLLPRAANCYALLADTFNYDV